MINLYKYFDRGANSGGSNFFLINMMSMMFLQLCYIYVPMNIFAVNNIFKRIFVIVGEQPESILK